MWSKEHQMQRQGEVGSKYTRVGEAGHEVRNGGRRAESGLGVAARAMLAGRAAATREELPVDPSRAWQVQAPGSMSGR